jgi:hypothetical protein
MAMSATHILIYCLLVWQFKLLNEAERSAIGSWIDKTFNGRSRMVYGD